MPFLPRAQMVMACLPFSRLSLHCPSVLHCALNSLFSLWLSYFLGDVFFPLSSPPIMLY